MADYTKHDAQELIKALSGKREELRTIRFAAAGSRSRNTKSASMVRKEIARILTATNAPKVAVIRPLLGSDKSSPVAKTAKTK